MTVQMQPVRQAVSPNYSARYGSVRLIVVHDTEGSYGGAVAWFAQTASQVSAHLVMSEDGSQVTQMVPLSAKAWHACSANSISIGIEGAGVEARGFSAGWWDGMAKIVAWLLRAYGLPCRWAQGGQGAGYCSHHDLGAAGGGHMDPVAVGSPEWLGFGVLVQAAYDELGKGPLSAWALHGLPNPALAELPPAVTPEPSHGGAVRNNPADAITVHQTTSGYPHGSVADLQWRLNEAGAAPKLTVDGLAGDLTRAAIVHFQATHGLYIDGLMGPKTWVALDGATT